MNDRRRITEEQVRREIRRMDDRAARRRAAIGTAVILAAALIVGALAARLFITLVDIRTDGMSGALADGDVAVCLRANAPLAPQEIRRGSLVLVRYHEAGMNRQAVRRVIGLGGDEIQVDGDGWVTVNGEALDEPYALYSTPDDEGGEVIPGGALPNPFADPDAPVPTPAAALESPDEEDAQEYPVTVPEGAVFVLCDNRNNRLDSRSRSFGMVSEANIGGVARAILWPVYRAGLLDEASAVE